MIVTSIRVVPGYGVVIYRLWLPPATDVLDAWRQRVYLN